ncbi:hypothetical protein [Lysobacter gummosus]|nr:hypothetical protein LG3211_4727 [Lysobacter gummosus]
MKHRFERVAGSKTRHARVAMALTGNGRPMHTKHASDVIAPDDAFKTPA